jgi:hypothetical protein
MIVDGYIQKIVNTTERKFGFIQCQGLDEAIYIPARVVEEYELEPEDEGVKVRIMTMQSTRPGTASHYVVAICTEDDLVMDRMHSYKEECERLRALLAEHGIAA